jgi:photosystem II stability/assembly factor-like uncharacterized protein
MTKPSIRAMRVRPALTRILRQPLAVSLLVCLVVGLDCPSVARSAGGANLPFTLAWTHGTCATCKTAKTVVGVEFVSTNEAWAVGYVPPGETGAGDYSILHTRNGGRTWSELPRSYQHNGPPSISFASQREGWIMVADIPNAEQRLLHTRDGGRHWSRLSLRDLSVQDVKYLGGGVGYAASFDVYAKQGYLYATRDSGKTWTKSALPTGITDNQFTFVNEQPGLLIGCLDHHIVATRSTDGGQNWGKPIAVSLTLQPPTIGNFCDVFVDATSFPDSQHGWILTRKRVFGLDDNMAFAVVSQTSDGGDTWTTVFKDEYQWALRDYTSVQFLDDHFGIITKEQTPADGDSEAGLLYSTDGGQTWQTSQLARPVQGCRPHLGTKIYCAGPDFWLLKITRTHQVSD